MAIEIVRKTLADGIEAYHSLAGDLESTRVGHKRTLAATLRDVSRLAWNVASGAQLQGRIKSVGSTLRKMGARLLRRDQILDTVGVRVIVPSDLECYRLIEQIHGRFDVLEGEYDDYIRCPKPSGYRSLHTTILGPDGHPVEVQVRTRWMHELAEHGPAAHWLYELRRRGRPLLLSPDRRHPNVAA